LTLLDDCVDGLIPRSIFFLTIHLSFDIMSDGWGNGATVTADTGGWANDTTTNAPDDGGAWGVDNGADDGGDDGAESKPAPPPLPFERREAPVAEWKEKKAYDYEAYAAGSTGNWAGNAQIYEWDGEQGDVGPEVPELEKILFGKEEERGDNEVIDFKK
jgi:hypothetical protein